eukprot:3604752-Alexandrium_andersonii.AAC.1
MLGGPDCWRRTGCRASCFVPAVSDAGGFQLLEVGSLKRCTPRSTTTRGGASLHGLTCWHMLNFG